ncbi:MAG: putative toxin-antitoxin system toxin component, PIN family [Chitinophagaceae bacterium]|nr:putative toxin-antitoxin system toxin component, PIN family [Chitinophagaceae bacterium]
MRSKKFVLDANIWVSYFISEQTTFLVNAVSAKRIVIFYCAELITEIKRVLNYPHLKKYGINIKEAVKIIKSISVEYTLIYPIKRYIPSDIDDDYVIALALQTNSGFVTSGDRNILDEKENLEKKYAKLKILTKAEFENRFL